MTEISKDFSKLDATKHMLELLSSKPYDVIWSDFEETLQSQVSGAALRRLAVTSDPDWVTVGNREEEDPNQLIVTMMAVAFEFELEVWSDERKFETLNGVYSWAAGNMHDPENRKGRIWSDINGTLDEFGSKGLLEERMRSLVNEE